MDAISAARRERQSRNAVNLQLAIDPSGDETTTPRVVTKAVVMGVLLQLHVDVHADAELCAPQTQCRARQA